MKKLFYLPLMLGAIAVAFTSCNGDDDPTSATLLLSSTLTQNDAPGVNRVLAATWGNDDQQHTVAYSAFGTTGFMLLLDATPHPSTLDTVGTDDFFTISNPNARTAIIWELEGFTSSTGAFLDADFAGWFYRATMVDTDDEYSYTFEFWVYADRAVSITGTDGGIDDGDRWEEVVSLNLVQGWNRVFETIGARTEEEGIVFFYTTTTSPVSGMTWVFDPANGDDDDTPTGTAMQANAQADSMEARVAERAAQRRSERR